MEQQRTAQRAKMAADLKARGIYHGKRLTSGLSNVPSNFAGSAAQRRRTKGTPEFNRQQSRNQHR